jgi:hypothetical protein
MKKAVFFALVSVLMLNLAIASHGNTLNQKELPRIEPQLRRLIAKAGIKQLLAKDIASKMEGQVLPKPIEFGHTAVDLFSDTEVCMTMDFSFGEQQGVLSLLFRWKGPIPILVDRSYWLVNTEVSEDISENTTWTPQGSPYYVTNPVSIYGGVTLTIGPGTVVRFRKFNNPQEHINLHVDGDGGTLLSQGSDANPVTFTSSCDFEKLDEIQGMGWESSDWESIQTGRNGNIIVRHTILEYANQAINTWEREGEIIVSDSEFTKCHGAVNTWGWNSVTVTDNIISDCWGGAINVGFEGVPDAGGDIAGNTITTRLDSWPWAVINVYSGIPNISDNAIIGYHFDHGIRADWLEPSAVIMGNTINILNWADNGISVGGGDCTISENEVTGSFNQGIGLGSDFHGVVTSNAIASPSDRSSSGIHAWGGDCTISENEITGSFNQGIGVEDFYGVVNSNTIHSDNSWSGIYAWWGDCTISENEITGFFEQAIGIENNGVVNSNWIDCSSWACIAVWGGDCTISENMITSPDWSWACIAVWAWDGQMEISGNTIEGYFDIGIDVEYFGSGSSVIGNRISGLGDQSHAIRIEGGEPTVEANPISGRFKEVILVVDESTATIINHCLKVGHDVYGNYGIYCVNSEPQIHGNDIEGNAECGVYNETPDGWTVYAENNWWGHDTGPYHPELNPGGQGDCVSDGVAFEPWLSEPVCPAAK